jgi:hypothetical protein
MLACGPCMCLTYVQVVHLLLCILPPALLLFCWAEELRVPPPEERKQAGHSAARVEHTRWLGVSEAQSNWVKVTDELHKWLVSVFKCSAYI